MSLNKDRSPEVILRYFDLLEWKKNVCKDRTAEEFLDSSKQELELTEKDLAIIQNLITEKSRFFLLAQKESTSPKSVDAQKSWYNEAKD
jgi:hypothetical protein